MHPLGTHSPLPPPLSLLRNDAIKLEYLAFVEELVQIQPRTVETPLVLAIQRNLSDVALFLCKRGVWSSQAVEVAREVGMDWIVHVKVIWVLCEGNKIRRVGTQVSPVCARLNVVLFRLVGEFLLG